MMEAAAAPGPEPVDLMSHALNPRAIAVIGASEDTNKTGGRAVDYLLRFGYRGAILPVNPKRATIQGIRAYPSVETLPVVPDMAILAVPGDAVLDTVEACAARGVHIAVITASGFGELGEAGRAREAAILAKARAGGMRVLGPNAQGIANFGQGIIASFSSLFLETPPEDGPVAIISQSGSMAAVPYGQLRERGIGVRYSIATGNQIDLTVGDFAKAVLGDPDIRLVLLYMESIPDAGPLAEAAALAREREAAVVAVKAGWSARGTAAARSHTGALASEDRVVQAFCEHHGIWRARDADELVRAAPLYLKGWRAAGKRLAILTDSGASAVMMTDTAARLGLTVEGFAAATRQALARRLPPFASAANPIDMTSALREESAILPDVLGALAGDATVDLFAVAFPSAGAGYEVESFAAAVAAFADGGDRPVAVAVPQARIAHHFAAARLPTYHSETEALLALHQMAAHAELMRAARPGPDAGEPIEAPTGEAGGLDEAEALAYLSRLGFPVVPHHLCHTAAEARAAFEALGPSVAVKGVALDLCDGPAVESAFDAMRARIVDLGERDSGVIVAAMCEYPWEFIVGAHLDPVFGPVVLLGEGGRHVEALGNTACLLPPVSVEDALRALAGLRGSAAWHGSRGEPAADLTALAEVACNVSDLMVRARGGIASIDLNPVAVGPVGRGAAILDALIEHGA